MKSVILNLQIAYKKNKIFKKKIIEKWLKKILPNFKPKTEITIRIVDKKEIQFLNMKYRGKNKPTNILSFKFESPKQISSKLIGDLVMCHEIIEKEALKINKNILEYSAYLIIHGCLHLFGYDHKNKKEEKNMKKEERKIMNKLGYQII